VENGNQRDGEIARARGLEAQTLQPYLTPHSTGPGHVPRRPRRARIRLQWHRLGARTRTPSPGLQRSRAGAWGCCLWPGTWLLGDHCLWSSHHAVPGSPRAAHAGGCGWRFGEGRVQRGRVRVTHSCPSSLSLPPPSSLHLSPSLFSLYHSSPLDAGCCGHPHRLLHSGGRTPRSCRPL
jgi:hypothetical protein